MTKENKKKRCSDYADHIYALTEEGSRKFFEMMQEPNPRAVKTLRRGKELLKDVDISKFGKEPVTMTFYPRCRICKARPCFCNDLSKNF